MSKKILVVVGTRPEAIKMAPLIKMLEQNTKHFDTKVCVTAQHREMLDQVLNFFDIRPDYDLDIMTSGQDLYDITSKVILDLKPVLEEFSPDLVMVHGDTTTTFASSIAAFYKKIQIIHIEAGLRTGDLLSPWPEEANRKLTSVLATIHFAPTETSRQNLLAEGINEDKITVTGNTVIDALYLTLNKINQDETKKIILKDMISNAGYNKLDNQFILVTGHRRENFGKGFLNICKALKRIAEENSNINLVYPVHMNPNVQQPVFDILKDVKNVFLIAPLEYEAFVFLMSKSYMIITDSGGIQEEAPSLGKPVLVMRDTTERPEAVDAGTVKLVGSNENDIYQAAQQLLNDNEKYNLMCAAHNPYGDGTACNRIIETLLEL